VQDHVLKAASAPPWSPPPLTPSRWRALAIGLVGLTALLAAAYVVVQEVRSGSATAPRSIKTWAVDLNSDPGDDERLRAGDRAVVGLNAWELDRLQEIKSQSPGTTVLVYKDMASVRSYPGALDDGQDAERLPTGVGYAEADRADPAWFLTDSTGIRLEWADYPGHWHVDVGDPDYQRLWIDNVLSELAAEGWDGVLIDNALSRADLYNEGRPSARYPTDESMQRATRSMLAAAGTALQDRGFAVHANIGDGRLNPGLFEDWGSLVTGPIEENFVTFRTGDGFVRLLDDDANSWRRQVDNVAASERAGQTPLVNVKGADNDEAALLYGLSSFLLATEGRGSLSHDTNGWFPAFDYDLGRPVGTMTTLPDGGYGREFTNGFVVVNPTGTAVTVTLPGPYLDASGDSVTTFRLASGNGVILRSV